MNKINDFLTKRLRRRDSSTKMASLAKRSSEGSLNGFSGIFSVAELNEAEKEELRALLEQFAVAEDLDIEADLSQLVSLTSEVKAINNQAAILHGERIKKAHDLLVKYRDGAFTTWLMKTYGNRQTPYNFLRYYLFFLQIPPNLKDQFEAMPRQAVYTLATREGELKAKQDIVENYKGQSKEELIDLIRDTFPISEADGRGSDPTELIISYLTKALRVLKKNRNRLDPEQKIEIREQLNLLVAQMDK